MFGMKSNQQQLTQVLSAYQVAVGVLIWKHPKGLDKVGLKNLLPTIAYLR